MEESVKETALFKLDLHQVSSIQLVHSSNYQELLCHIIRVPGGWIYKFLNTSCFVPLSREFAPNLGSPEESEEG